MNSLLAGLQEATEYVRRDNRRGGPRWTPPTGEKLQRMRHDLGLTQAEFAERFGLDLTSLRKWEQGRAKPEQVTCLMLGMIAVDAPAVEQLVSRTRLASFREGSESTPEMAR